MIYSLPPVLENVGHGEEVSSMFVYNTKDYGDYMIYEDPGGQYQQEEIFIGDHFISITEDIDNKRLVIQIFENSKTTKIISNVEMEVNKHEKDNYYSVKPKL